MRLKHSTEVLSARKKVALSLLAAEEGVREVWLFGSAAASNGEAEPNDIDVALLGVLSSAKESLATSLRRRFAGCRVDDALAYRAPEPGLSPPEIHFVLADDTRDFWSHPISRSIRRGVCLTPND